MFAIENNGELFFMEARDGNIRIIKNQEPTGFAQDDDNRLFRYSTNIHKRSDILMHVVNQAYITHWMTGRGVTPSFAKATKDPAQAINICMQYKHW